MRAQIESLAGISGHGDRDILLHWLGAMGKPPKQVFVNHGEDEVCDAFADTIARALSYPALAPFSGDVYDLVSGECTAKGKVVRVSKASPGKVRANALYDRLYSAGTRLLSVIKKNQGLSNKELSKFADRVKALCDQYDRS